MLMFLYLNLCKLSPVLSSDSIMVSFKQIHLFNTQHFCLIALPQALFIRSCHDVRGSVDSVHVGLCSLKKEGLE